MQFGIRRVSMDDLALALGISKKTLYLNYPDKENLVAEVIEAILAANTSNCKTSRSAAGNAIEEGFIASENLFGMLKRLNPVLLFDLQRYYPKAYKKFLVFKEEFLFDFFRTSIEWGIRDGLFRNDINVNLISRFRIESINISFQQNLVERLKLDLAAIQEEIFLLFLYGIATPKGLKLIDKYKTQMTK